jgi:hypothetical protein
MYKKVSYLFEGHQEGSEINCCRYPEAQGTPLLNLILLDEDKGEFSAASTKDAEQKKVSEGLVGAAELIENLRRDKERNPDDGKGDTEEGIFMCLAARRGAAEIQFRSNREGKPGKKRNSYEKIFFQHARSPLFFIIFYFNILLYCPSIYEVKYRVLSRSFFSAYGFWYNLKIRLKQGDSFGIDSISFRVFSDCPALVFLYVAECQGWSAGKGRAPG